ncbi:hypothetical protein Tco_0449369 [Tanacetum coccineum]
MMNERQMQSKEGKVDSSKSLDAINESSGTESRKQDTSNSSGNYLTHTVDANIRPVNDQVPFDEVQLTAQHNVLANEQQHTRQSKPIYDTYLLEKVDSNTTPDSTNMSHRGRVIDQDAKQYQVKSPLLNAELFKTKEMIKKETESPPAKPHHVNAPNSSRNSQKESYGSNDMAHTYFLEESRKKTQDRNRIPNPRDMASARTHRTPNSCTPKPRNISRCLHVSNSSCITSNVVPLVDHSRNSSSFSDSKHFLCSTCQKCVFNANHDACVTKFLNEVKSHARKPSHKTTTRYKPVEKTSNTKKPGRQIAIGQRFSLNKSSAMHEKPNTPRSCLRWIPTGRIFKTAGLRTMPSPNHPTPDFEKTFSSNFPDYFPATSENNSPDSSNDFTKYLLDILVFSPLHDDLIMEIMQAYDATDNELPTPPL